MEPGDKLAIAGTRPPGRPRLYEPDEERDRILVAALEVLRRNEGEEASVADILQEAALSTRAFYRHFETKEDVIRSLYERDADSFGAHLSRRVESAADPEEALSIWVFEMLGLGYDRRRAERMSALRSPMVLRVVAGTRAQQLGSQVLVEPLRTVLEQGLACGWFPNADPEIDMRLIRAITMEVVGWAQSGVSKLSRKKAADHIVRFSRAALGAVGPT
jgi:AcrR family transcriptional regulator